MKQELGDIVAMGQHKTARGVQPAHIRFADRRLIAAFLRLTAHLKRDPEPRFIWTNRRRASNPQPCPGQDAVTAARIALRAAVETGSRQTIEATALEIEAFAEEMKAAMLADYHALSRGVTSVSETGLAAHKEVGEAEYAIAHALVTRSPGAMERAIAEAVEGESALHRFCDVARTTLSRPPLHAVR